MRFREKRQQKLTSRKNPCAYEHGGRWFVVDVTLFSGQYVIFKDGDINSPQSLPREWTNEDFNFDNVANGMLTLFTVATFEGWPE